MRRRCWCAELCDRTSDRLGEMETMSVVIRPFYRALWRKGEPHGSEGWGGDNVAQGGVQAPRAAIGATQRPPVEGVLGIPGPGRPGVPGVPGVPGRLSFGSPVGGSEGPFEPWTPWTPWAAERRFTVAGPGRLGASRGGSPW